MTPEAFQDEMLRHIRRDFFSGSTDKQFFQELKMLGAAITFPAQWMNERGVKAPASKYRQIIHTVIAAIKRHGAPQKRRFSVYFLYCVQQHMAHHGDEYYYEAKAVPSLHSMMTRALRTLHQPRSADNATEILAGVHKVLSARGAIQKGKKADSEKDLFSQCKAAAISLQKA